MRSVLPTVRLRYSWISRTIETLLNPFMERDYFGLTGVADKAIAMYNFNYRSDKPVDDSARRVEMEWGRGIHMLVRVAHIPCYLVADGLTSLSRYRILNSRTEWYFNKIYNRH